MAVPLRNMIAQVLSQDGSTIKSLFMPTVFVGGVVLIIALI